MHTLVNFKGSNNLLNLKTHNVITFNNLLGVLTVLVTSTFVVWRNEVNKSAEIHNHLKKHA